MHTTSYHWPCLISNNNICVYEYIRSMCVDGDSMVAPPISGPSYSKLHLVFVIVHHRIMYFIMCFETTCVGIGTNDIQ